MRVSLVLLGFDRCDHSSPPQSSFPASRQAKASRIIESVSGGAFVRQRDIPNLNILVGPLVEQLDAANFVGYILGQDLVAAVGRFDFDFSVVRHVGDVIVSSKRSVVIENAGRRCRWRWSLV